MTERTLVLIKPDCVRKRMIGQVITAIENLALRIKNLQHRKLSTQEAENLYKEHSGKWHFARNIKHVTSGPVIILHVEGSDALNKCRQFVEQFREAHQDIIQLPKNLVHATSEASKASRELEAVGCTTAVPA